MITSLRVANFALINQLDLDLRAGFSAITGETGSGKSILLGALELLLGERADFSLIGPASDKAVVEAGALITNYDLHDFFTQNDLDFADHTIIRREISSSGRSRAFINDTPVQLTILKEFTSRLVNIHSQYNTLELKDRDVQLEIMDTIAGLTTSRKEYAALYRKYKQKSLELNAKEEELANLLKLKDYNSFQLSELEGLDLLKVNYAALEKELSLAENSEQIVQVAAFLVDGLAQEGGVLEFLGKIKNELEKVRSIDQDLEDFYNRTNSTLLELKELMSDAQRYAETVDIDPRMKLKLTEQIDKFNHALRKHQLNDQVGLIELVENLGNYIEGADQLETEIILLRDEADRLRHQVTETASDLHLARMKAVPFIEDQIAQLLAELKMETTTLSFNLEKKEEVGQNGITTLTMRFSANKGIEAIPIEKAASGGELSRVMLALQKLVSEKRAMPTVLFDEIDTGVSGDVAQKIGILLRKMGENMQLIAITHLPQVAARAQHHFKVEKFEANGRTVSAVRELSESQHIEEVARLMSGETISEEALSNARALMNS
jgi:DNA repair protein RecN (Recombination protein N)